MPLLTSLFWQLHNSHGRKALIPAAAGCALPKALPWGAGSKGFVVSIATGAALTVLSSQGSHRPWHFLLVNEVVDIHALQQICVSEIGYAIFLKSQENFQPIRSPWF
jgi:hypothetical protein